MKRLIETEDLENIARRIISNVDLLELLDDNEGGDIEYYTPEIRQAVEDLRIVANSAELTNGG